MRGEPGPEVIAAFRGGRSDPATPVPGGQGRAFRCGDIFLKPVDDTAEAEWCAETFAAIKGDGFRVPGPIRASHG